MFISSLNLNKSSSSSGGFDVDTNENHCDASGDETTSFFVGETGFGFTIILSLS
jgi:hypothetical protein